MNNAVHAAAISTDKDLGSELPRIEFARETLRGIQLLIQLLDQKSYLVLVIMGVTSAAFFSIVGAYLGKIERLLSPQSMVPLLAAWFLVEAGLVLWYCLKSIQGVVAKPVTMDAPNMVFPHSLLRHYDSNPLRYFDRLCSLEADDILRDYAAEIIKTSTIFVEKSHQVNDAVRALYRSMLPWMAGILATIALRVM
ncbi:MAG: hypothetical protein HYX63_06170 [Gammaproteobacteria bacterium]|nr:hypothetical protein [Gammaproteobacteria bacterium]